MDKIKMLAKALLEIPEDEPGKVLREIKLTEEIMNIGLKDLMGNPILTKEQKFNITEKLLKSHLSPELLKFIRYLIKEEQLNNFSKIVGKYEKLLDKQAKTLKIEAITAAPLTDEKLKLIKEKLMNKFNREPFITNIVDQKVLSGIAIKIGDKVYNNTINDKINKLYQSLTA